MRYTNKEQLECLLALDMARENNLSVLDMVREQCQIEGDRKRMAEVNSAVELFLKDKADMGIAKTSLRTLRSIVSRFAVVFDGRLLDEVTHSEIKQWVQDIGLATRTKNGYVKEVKNLYNWCVREGIANTNPTARISAYRPSIEELEAKENAKEILTVKEVRTLFANADGAVLPRLAIMLYAGTRPERESASLTWDNIYMDDGILHVPASKAKDRRERYIKMCEQLVNWLAYCKQHNLTLPVQNWDAQWAELKDTLGLLGRWPNSCTRHTFASYNISKYGEELTKNTLGHGNYEMLFKHYRTLVHPHEAEEYFNLNLRCEQLVA